MAKNRHYRYWFDALWKYFHWPAYCFVLRRCFVWAPVSSECGIDEGSYAIEFIQLRIGKRDISVEKPPLLPKPPNSLMIPTQKPCQAECPFCLPGQAQLDRSHTVLTLQKMLLDIRTCVDRESNLTAVLLEIFTHSSHLMRRHGCWRQTSLRFQFK